MKILSVKNNKLDSTFEVEVDEKTWKSSLAKTKKELAKNIQIPGFRKGFVPEEEFNKRVSEQEIAYRSIEKMQNNLIQEVIDSKEFKDSSCIDSVSKLEIVKYKPTAVLNINFELVPEVSGFSAKDVKDIAVPPFKPNEVTDETVQQQIRMMIRPDAMVSIKKDGIVANGNIAVIDFKGFIDDKAFAGGEGKNFELEIGSKTFIDNFEEQLIGCKKGDKKTINVTFPKNYHSPIYAGKPAKFDVEIKDVKEIEYPEINKQYCKKFMLDCDNKQQLADHLKKLFLQEQEMRYQEEALKIINAAIAKKAKLNIYPKGLMDIQTNEVLKRYQQEATNAGFKTIDQYKKALGLTDETFGNLLHEAGKSALNVSMTYEKLIDEYNLEATKEDQKDYLDKLTRYLGDEKRAKEMIEKNQEAVEKTIIKEKLFKRLVQEAKKQEPEKIVKKPAVVEKEKK